MKLEVLDVFYTSTAENKLNLVENCMENCNGKFLENNNKQISFHLHRIEVIDLCRVECRG